MALFKGIHLSSRHLEDPMDPKDVPVKSRYFFNEVSVFFLFITLIRVVPRNINLVPLWDWGFFVFKKGGILYAGTFRRTTSRSAAKGRSIV